MTIETEPDDGILRRTVLKASALGAVALGSATVASADEDMPDNDGTGRDEDGATGPEETSATGPEETDADESEETGVDEPEGFGSTVLADHATFADDVALEMTITYAEGEMGTREVEPTDGESVVVAEVTWEPGGRSGWHTHPGPVVVSVSEGELHLVNEDDCVTRTYAAGEAFVAPGQGNVHGATNASDTDPAAAYVLYLGVPAGEPPTEWVAPVDC